MTSTHYACAGPRDLGLGSLQRTDVLFAQAASEDLVEREATLHRIVELHIPVARSIARRYAGRGVELDDLEQTACMALLHVVRRFDPALGHEFLAYAVPSIRGSVRKYFRDYGWMVRPPRSVQELQPRILAHAFERDPRSGRPLTPEDVAARLGTTAHAVREAAKVSGCFTPTSLDAPAGPEQQGTVMDRLPGWGDRGYEAAEARVALLSVLPALSVEDRLLLQLRFVDERTQQEIGDELGFTQAHVSKRLRRILDDLRKLLAGNDALVEAAC